MSLKSFIYMIVVVFLIWVLSGWILLDNPDRGTFGDMFGAINALFSGLAFAGLIYTILLQRHELSLTRDELQGQRKELESQARELTIQNFENRFFQLMNLHVTTLNSIDITTENGTFKGRDAFVIFYERLKTRFNMRVRQPKNNSSNRIIFSNKSDKEVINEFFSYNIHELGHYFKSFENIILFIISANIESKKFYIDVLKSQLSQQELLIILYNSLNNEKLNKLLVENEFTDESLKSELLDNTHYDIYINNL